MIKEKISKLEIRTLKTLPQYELIKGKRIKTYEYLVCDYCGSEINMSVTKNNRTGGIMKLPWILTKASKDVYIACCNKCVNKVLAEFNYKS